jgi:hypothetical protein
MQTVKMFGPALSGPARLVNRDVPIADEQAYVRAGYKRGSIPEPVDVESAPETPVKTGAEPTPEPKPSKRRKVVSE